MKVANLIVTYTNPKLTERLIKRLGSEHFDYYIHVDKKNNISEYTYLTKYPNVFLVKERIDVRWAGYNTTRAVFSCIRDAVASGKTYSYFNLISGQDYPIKSPGYIIDFFERNKGKEFIEYADIDTEWTEAQVRLKKYDLANYSFPGKYVVQDIFNAVLPERKLPFGLKPYGKSMFWMLSPEKASYVLNTVDSKPRLAKFFNYTWGGDEIVFQTLLCNSAYKASLVNDGYRYIDWSQGGGHPKLLSQEDFESMKNSKDLFGRKFAAEGEGEIFDLLDAL